jgi:predicted Zn-dependent protease
VEALTGLTLDAGQGTIQVLDNEGWRKRREQLEERGGSPENTDGPRLDPIPYGPDPRARGRGLMERGQWEDAEAAFNELVRARPYNASTWIELSRFHITRGQPERAVADFDLAISLHPEDLRMRHCHALSLLSQGDQAGLHQACADLLGRYAAGTDPQRSNAIAWSCVISPDSVADRTAPVRFAEAALAGFPTDEKPAAMNTLGAALYRAGQCETAIRCLEEGIQQRNGVSLPQDWAFLALAHDRLGHRAQALRWLHRFQTYKALAHPDAFWNDLEVRLLRREAEAQILLDPIFPADPFAH